MKNYHIENLMKYNLENLCKKDNLVKLGLIIGFKGYPRLMFLIGILFDAGGQWGRAGERRGEEEECDFIWVLEVFLDFFSDLFE